MLMGLLLLRLVSEACHISMSAQLSTEYHWLACTGNRFAGNHYPTGPRNTVGHGVSYNV